MGGDGKRRAGWDSLDGGRKKGFDKGKKSKEGKKKCIYV